MAEFLKISATALVCAVLYAVVKQYRPDYAVIVGIGGVTAIAVFALEYTADVLGAAQALAEFSGMDSGYIKLLIKALGIAVVAQTAGDVCRDSGNSSLGSGIELAGKLVILGLSLPMIKAMAQLAVGLIG